MINKKLLKITIKGSFMTFYAIHSTERSRINLYSKYHFIIAILGLLKGKDNNNENK